ncbi:MAG: 16S rRNA (cytosine(1402)-N(4))-methyltransferase [Desulfococcus sp.]|nr:MAG: 16S rRNA (cytosine(1402)-N(4))-methyltransferase [Desulfococcus sp.]
MVSSYSRPAAVSGPPDARSAYHHVSVLLEPMIRNMKPRSSGVYADCTLGGGGHTRALLAACAPGGRLIALDRDAAAIQNSRPLEALSGGRLRLFHAPFSRLADCMAESGIDALDGIMADLGLSTFHLNGSGRGFSFERDEPLDMRMDERTARTAADIIRETGEDDLADLFRRYGEERFSGRIARRIVAERRHHPVDTSRRLAEIITSAVPGPKPGREKKGRNHTGRKKPVHPATRVFMALRIAVNGELDQVTRLMTDAPDLLAPGGRLCVISFHSLEDRIIKQRMAAEEKGCTCPPRLPGCVCGKKTRLRRVFRKSIPPSPEEVAANPPSRSARMRVAERLFPDGAGETDIKAGETDIKEECA